MVAASSNRRAERHGVHRTQLRHPSQALVNGCGVALPGHASTQLCQLFARVVSKYAEHRCDVCLRTFSVPAAAAAAAQIDRLYGWKSAPDTPVRDAFKRQKDFVMKEFEQRSEQVFLQLNEQVGLCVFFGDRGQREGTGGLLLFWPELPAAAKLRWRVPWLEQLSCPLGMRQDRWRGGFQQAAVCALFCLCSCVFVSAHRV